MSYTGKGDKPDLNNHANQCNPNNSGHTPGYPGTGTKADVDNHSNQQNPNHSSYQPKGGKPMNKGCPGLVK
jgi:hypothetical protein